MRTAGQLVSELAEHRYWEDLSGRPFARTGGHCVHVRGCSAAVVSAYRQLLTRYQAEEFLRESHEHTCCAICGPDIPEPTWIRVRSAGGQVRWRLADDVDPGEVL